MFKIVVVAGVRPNFVKVAPIVTELDKYSSRAASILVHTGQHYGAEMSDSFFHDLNIRQPDVYLGIGSGSHAYQTGETMKRFEVVLEDVRPDLVIVVGDVNSTLACALTSAKLHIHVAHIEAGLRSFDRTMPEEVNRVLTDHISDLLFVTEESGYTNLVREGINAERIHFVGNVMIDSLRNHLHMANSSSIVSRWGLTSRGYGLVTLHRPSNVDNPGVFQGILTALDTIGKKLPLLFSLHPRTALEIRKDGLNQFFAGEAARDDRPKLPGLYWTGPIRYIEFLCLMKNARLVLTDSGGIQEETTAMEVPCLTLRNNTERPSTIEYGTNQLIGTSSSDIVDEAIRVLSHPIRSHGIPPLWDGHAAKRIVDVLLKGVQHEDLAACTRSAPDS